MIEKKSAFVAIIGCPNVGKSSLLNQLVGEKIAIVSNKPQTTRTRITGVLTQADTQFVFFDTPGLHKPKTKLGNYMVKTVHSSVADVDVAILVTEPYGGVKDEERELLESCRQKKIPVVLAINKIDQLPHKEKLMEKMQTFSQAYSFDAIIPISVLQQDGIDELLQQIDAYAQPGPHFFPDDMLTDQPERVIVGEIIREKMLQLLREEIPHGTGVMIEQMRQREQGKEILDIQAVILCEKASHKGIIIGKGGAMLKAIASAARADIEEFLSVQVNLQCWVKIKEDWRNKEMIIRSLGFTQDK